MWLTQVAFSQTGSIKGSVHSPSGELLNGVRIGIKGEGKSTISDGNGNYQLNNIPTGQHQLIAIYLDSLTSEETVFVKANETLELNINLKSVYQEVQEVTVSTDGSHIKEPSSSLRIDLPLLEAAQNIQVVSAKTLEEQQVYDMLSGVERNVSGAQRLEHWDNYARINMRGSQITPFRNGMNVHLSPWSPLTEDMSVVERIEFVKGPAGFMLGNGEPSGFYNVVTKKPTGENKGSANIALGSFNLYRAAVDLDGLITKNGKLQYRLNIMGQSKGSHRDFEYNNSYVFAPVIKYEVNNKTSLTLEYNEHFVQMSAIGSNYAFSKNGYADLPRNFTTAEANMDPTDMVNRSILGILEHQFNDNWKLTAQGAFLYDRQVGQSLWPWGVSTVNDSLMQRGVSIWDALGYNRNAQVFVNGNFDTGSFKHHLIVGLDMSQRDYWADWSQGAAFGDSTFNIYNPVYGTVSAGEMPQWDRSQDIKERAVQYSTSYTSFYVQDVIGVFDDKLKLTLAGRYTSLTALNPYSGTYTHDKVTPRLGLNWNPIRDFALYAVYDQAFLSNPGRDWEGNTFDPITGGNKEIGVKRDWFRGRLSSTLSAYLITKNNVLTTDLEHPDPISGQFIYSIQTGQQQTKGVEIDLRGTITKGLKVVVNYAFTDAQITKDANPDFVGRSVAGATKHIQNTWLTYELPTTKLKGLTFNLGYQYQAGRSSWYVFDNSEQSLPDYFRLDGGIGYSFEKVSVGVMINNILDDYLYSGAPTGNMYYWQAEAGRNFRVNIGYKF